MCSLVCFPQGKLQEYKCFCSQFGISETAIGGPNPPPPPAPGDREPGSGDNSLLRVPSAQAPHLSALSAPVRKRHPGAFGPVGDSWRDWIRVRTTRWGKRVGRGTSPGRPSRWVTPPVQTPKGATRTRFLFTRERGLSLRKKKHKKSQLARLFWFFVCLPPN